MAETEHRLAPPGAGIPISHKLLVRCWALPRVMRRRDWDARQKAFRREGDKVMAILKSIPAVRLAQRTLVAPMIGLEDSSRNWSVLLAVEHMVTVGDRTSEMILGLSQGRTGFPPADPAKVKPVGTLNALNVVDRFGEFLNRFQERLDSVHNRESRFRFRHPWFGKLTAAQWQAIALMHQALHRRQCEAILKAQPPTEN